MGSLLKGETLKLRGERGTITIHWKQGSVAGFGGDRSQTYVLCEYATHNDYSVPIYIQKGYEIKQNFTIDFRFQDGAQDSVMFFVYHDKSQTPYQQRFRCMWPPKVCLRCKRSSEDGWCGYFVDFWEISKRCLKTV